MSDEYVCTYMPDNWGEKYRPHLGEPIVRCRDCRYMETYHPFDVNTMKLSEYAEYHCESSQFSNWDWPIEVEPSGFCAWGERRDAE